MSRHPKTLETIFDEIRAYHQRLVEHLKLSRDRCQGEREKLLLDFIVDHEQWLCSSLDDLEHDQSPSALNTWFYDYEDPEGIIFSNPAEIPFATMSYDAISEKIRDINQQVIDLLKNLKERAQVRSSETAVDTLLNHVSTNARNLVKETAEGF